MLEEGPVGQGEKRELLLTDNAQATALLGPYNRNLNYINEHFPATVRARGTRVVIEGEPQVVAQVELLLQKLVDLVASGQVPTVEEVEYLAEQLKEEPDGLEGVLSEVIQRTRWGEEIRPKTVGQQRYVQAIRDNEIVFGIGPSGTGKTYLAVAMAIDALKRGTVQRLILTRPAVEAGEELGFLPGDIQAKISPYLRPLYDAIYDMLPADEVTTYMENGRIEIAPLAYMRGRTLNNSFIILDEAQNTTSTQMKMFLTRLGFHSRMVVTGDVTQIDLERGTSGLKAVERILKDLEGISFVYLDRRDVVRHRLVKRIIEAYEKAEQAKQN
jgi:phosphate starvation-inducible PhoH-like protein